MARVVVAILASLGLFSGILVESALSFNGCAPPQCAPPQCAPPQQCYVTRMVPCKKTEMVPEVVKCMKYVPVQKTAWRCQKVMLKGTPVGRACGQDPCTTCCPQPFCQVVDQKVPYCYTEYKAVPYYTVNYKPVCRTFMLPQTYLVQACPMPCQ